MRHKSRRSIDGSHLLHRRKDQAPQNEIAAHLLQLQVTNGLVAKGTLAGHDFLGPMLLPLGQHLPASILEDR